MHPVFHVVPAFDYAIDFKKYAAYTVLRLRIKQKRSAVPAIRKHLSCVGSNKKRI